MLNKDQIITALKALDRELASINIYGEINIVGGAVMCLAFNARNSTQDIDAIMAPAEILQKAAFNVSESLQLNNYFWINDSAKVFMSRQAEFVEFNLSLSHLKVMLATPEYMFAMKILSARSGTNDETDVIFLKKELKLKTADQALLLINYFYSKQKLSPESLALLKDLFEEVQ